MKDIMTYQDAVDVILDEFDVDRSERNLRIARRALNEAYKKLCSLNRWSCYDRHHTLHTVAPYSTGTIAYDHTGGAHERMVTLTTGTWPTWAARGRIVIDEHRYEVDQRISDSIITLIEDSNPGADVTAGETYSIERPQYALPTNFRRHISLFDHTGNLPVPIADEGTTRNNSNIPSRQPGTPVMASIVNAGDQLTVVSLEFSPTPDEARMYDLFYEAYPRPLVTENECAGTAVITSAGYEVVGTSTAFSALHVGSVIRFSADAITGPTSLVGHREINKLNQYQQQRQIVRYASATSIFVDEPFTASLSGVKFTISDPLDMDQEFMVPALLRMAEHAACRSFNSTPANQQMRERDMNRDIRLAMENCLRARPQAYPIAPINPEITTTAEA